MRIACRRSALVARLPIHESMWIEEIFIEHFGGIDHFKVGNLSPHLNVIAGPNEAGKTTVAAFIRSILVGFPKLSSRTNTYETPDGAPRSGWLTAHTPANGMLLARRQERPGRRSGVLQVSSRDGGPVDPSLVSGLRDDGAPTNDAQSLFAFDLDNLSHLDREGLRSRIVGAALGSVDVNPTEVLRSVNDRIKRLGKRSLKDDYSLVALQSRLRHVEKRLRMVDEKPHRYVELKEELETIVASKGQLGAQISTHETELERLRQVLACENDWNKLISLEKRISGLEDARDFPADGLSRLELLQERLSEAETTKDELHRQISMLRERVDRLKPDQGYVDQSPAIFALSEQAHELAGYPSRIERLKAAISQASEVLEDEIVGLGGDWTRNRVAGSDPSLVVEKEIARFEDAWRKLSERVDVLRVRVADHERNCEKLAEQVTRKQRKIAELSPSCRGFLSPEHRGLLMQWKELDTNAALIRQRIQQANHQMEKLSAALREVDARLKTIGSGQSWRTPWMLGATLLQLAGTGGMFVTYWAADLTGWLPSTVFGVGCVLLFSTISSVVLMVARARANEKRLKHESATLRQERDRIVQEIRTIRISGQKLASDLRTSLQRMTDVTRTVLGNPHSRREDILKAENRSLAVEESVRTRRALEETLAEDFSHKEIEMRRKAEAVQGLQQAEHDFARLQETWNAFLDRQGLDQGISPETGIILVRRLRDLKRDLQHISEQESSLARLQQQWDQFVSAAEELAGRLGSRVSAETPILDLVSRWVRRSREAAESLTAGEGLIERIQECRIRLETATNKAYEVGAVIGHLMESAGVDDEEGFRHQGRRHEQFRSLELERDLLVDRLTAGLGFHGQSHMRQSLSREDWQSDKRRAAGHQAAMQMLRTQQEELAEREGRVSREIEALEAEEQTERLAAEREELLTRLNDGLEEWATLKLASALLSRTIRLYESDKQPRVMARASELFRFITGGAFTRVLLPLDSKSVQVERNDGTYLAEELLSRGTLEQVYLVLRLAHLDVCRFNGHSNPVLMDDVLVNFDPDRGKRTAQALTDFAEETGIQILFFTCHPHVEKLFPDCAVRVRLGSPLSGSVRRTSAPATV